MGTWRNIRTINQLKWLAKIRKFTKKLEHDIRFGHTRYRSVLNPWDCPKSIKPVPVIGDKHHFFDDGKIKESRHYDATIIDIVPFKKVPQKLKKAWKLERDTCTWLYAYTTDYFVKCSIPKYDKYPIWCVRTVDGGWFSIDYPNCWMGGRLMEVTFNYEEFLAEQQREIDEWIRKRKEKQNEDN